MHVCIISPTSITDKADWGGIHTHTQMLCRILIKQRIKVTLITSGCMNAADEKIIDDARVVCVSGVARRTVDNVWIKELRRSFIKIHKEEPIDCIFSENYWAYGLQKELAKNNVPIFTFIHNFSLTHFYNNSKDIKNIRSLASYLLKTIPRIVFRIFKYELPFYHNSKHVVSVSTLNAGYLQRIYRLPQDKLKIMPNWVDAVAFSPDDSMRSKFRRDLNIHKSTLVFLLVGSLWRGKGFHIAIAAFKQLLKKFPDSLLLIAGEGCEEKYLRTLAGDNKEAGKKTVFLGRLDRNGLPYLYNAADVFLMPSIISEGCSYGPIEAMSCGVPVIASRRGGNIETVGNAGILVTPGNIKSLTEAMVYLAQSHERREYFSTAARTRAVENFSEKIAGQELLQLIEKAMNEKKICYNKSIQNG
ncbi:MAG: glycosyltransferase family 4 protein [Candidatus Omnitrophota bacterium]|nr:MAG: glycosyltransferase family 4 protein [Candidatus Omnitrophota bacterium]